MRAIETPSVSRVACQLKRCVIKVTISLFVRVSMGTHHYRSLCLVFLNRLCALPAAAELLFPQADPVVSSADG